MNERYQIVKGMHEIIRCMNNEEAYMDWIPLYSEVPIPMRTSQLRITYFSLSGC